jgi:glycosyltransferase involved in cell wall biosynthesis
MTVYNREAYLRPAINSLLAQTFTNWELILWLDGCTDGSESIAKEFSKKDDRVILVIAEHMGRVPALIEAHKMVSGDYFCWFDSDDIMHPNAISATLLYMGNPLNGAVYSNYEVIDANGHNHGLGHRCHIKYSSQALLLDFMVHHFRLMRTELFTQVGGIDAELSCAPDYDLCLKYSEVAEIIHLPEVLYYYREHEDSISVSQRKQQLKSSLIAIRKALVRRGLYPQMDVYFNTYVNLEGKLCGRYWIEGK